MAGKAVVRWPSPVLARISRFRPMSPASQVRLEAYRFESCRERFCVCVCVCVCVLIPWVPEDIFFLWTLMVRGEAALTRRKAPRRKK